MDVGELAAGLGWTALLTAYSRAQESRGAEPLFVDPLASAFVTAVVGEGDGERMPSLGFARDDGSSRLWNAFRCYFAQRTPFYDAQVMAAVADGCRQVVILGAGLDARAFRLGLPGDVTVFEVDQAPVHEFKEKVLRRHGAVPRCARVPVAVDVTNGVSESLLSAGFDPAVPAIWTAEGLLFYLSAGEADRLAGEITALSAPGSRFAGEYFGRRWEKAHVEYETLPDGDRMAWDLLIRACRYGPIDHLPTDWLAKHGWTARDVTTVAEVGTRSGRPVPPEFARADAPPIWLFAGTRAVISM